jgi:hypothetical protein
VRLACALLCLLNREFDEKEQHEQYLLIGHGE